MKYPCVIHTDVSDAMHSLLVENNIDVDDITMIFAFRGHGIVRMSNYDAGIENELIPIDSRIELLLSDYSNSRWYEVNNHGMLYTLGIIYH